MDNYSIYVIPVIYRLPTPCISVYFVNTCLQVYLKSYPHLYFHRYFTWQGFPFYQMRSFSRHHHLSMASRTIEQRRTILLSNLGFVCFIGKRKNNTTNTKRQMKKGDGNFIAHIFTYFLLIVITVIWDFLLCIFFIIFGSLSL